MEPTIVEITEKQFIGMRMKMSYANNKTGELFRGFMPRHRELSHTKPGVFAIHVYDQDFKIEAFTPATVFEKWAAMEVTEMGKIPEGMESLTIEAGKYAVFIHKGLSKDFPKTSQYIYQEWLPKSDYSYDNRIYFERMGEKFLGMDNPNSEEEIWVPIK